MRCAGPSPPPEAPSTKSRECLLVKSLREPDAVEPQVRFDERRRETEPRPRLRHRHDGESRRQQLLPRPTVTAPAVDSTLYRAGADAREVRSAGAAMIAVATNRDHPGSRCSAEAAAVRVTSR